MFWKRSHGRETGKGGANEASPGHGVRSQRHVARVVRLSSVEQEWDAGSWGSEGLEWKRERKEKGNSWRGRGKWEQSSKMERRRKGKGEK